jgi:caffeoyl-CoA O-methyltransferase
MDDLFEKQQYHTTNWQYEQYAVDYSMPDDELMSELVRRTHLSFTTSSMLSGMLQGRLLQMFCQMMSAKTVLEIGTYTGYSSIYMARGLADDGILHTIDNNPEVADIVDEFITRAGLTEKITAHQGNALEIIPQVILPGLNNPLDLVFIDADKENYINYYNLCFDKVKNGGFIIADNVLWYGRVFNESAHNDKETKGIIAFNKMVKEDDRVENLLLPLRDGLMILRKK